MPCGQNKMHCNTHGTAGIAILTTCYLITKSKKKTYILGGLIAFGSHYVLDLVGESGYKSMLQMNSIEVSIFLFSMILMYRAGIESLKLAFFGFFMANLMDVIDKKAYLAILLPKEYKFTYYFHSKDQVLYPISYEATLGAALFSLILVLICFFCLNSKEHEWN